MDIMERVVWVNPNLCFNNIVYCVFSLLDWNWSVILTVLEHASLVNMTESSTVSLLYRATKDGFKSKTFHDKCNGKENTITIIKTNDNYVFGGFTAAKWNSDFDYIADSKSFLFSLRRNGTSCCHKFKVNDTNYAIYGSPNYGPTFGSGYDIFIKDKSNINIGSYSNLGRSYHYPPEKGDSKAFLAGSYDGWLTTEIEVYQINK